MEKICPRKKGHPSYPGRANFSNFSIKNEANRLHEKQKVGWAKRATRLTLPSQKSDQGPLLYPYKHCALPSWVNSVKARQ